MGKGNVKTGGYEGRPRSISSFGVAPQPLTCPAATYRIMIPMVLVCAAPLSYTAVSRSLCPAATGIPSALVNWDMWVGPGSWRIGCGTGPPHVGSETNG